MARTTAPAAARHGTKPMRHRKTMLGAIRSEARRLRRRTFVGVGAGLVVLFALVGTLVAFLAGDGLGQAGAPPGMGVPVALESSQGLVAGLSMSADLLGIVALSLWAAAAASDYSSGWIRVLVQAEPRRWRLLAGKFCALAVFTVAATAIATAVSVAAAPALAAATEVSTELWAIGRTGTVIGGWLNLTISTLIWGTIGFAVATSTRSAVVAISGGVGYLMVFEGLLGLAAEEATTYLPGSVLGAVVAGGTDDLTYSTALLLAAGIAVIAAGISTVTFHRRDIVS